MSKKYNDSIAIVNDNRFGFKTVKLPDWTEDEEDWELVEKDWADLDLNDKDSFYHFLYDNSRESFY